jgi:iron complex transport system substrate-binding protein
VAARRLAVCRWSSLLVLVAPLAGCAGQPPRHGPSDVDDWGRTVALAAPARRIVSLSPSTTEIVFALGLGGRLVGRTRWCDHPPAARGVADVGDGLAPNVEAIAARRPDLVLLYASPANRPAAQRLEALGIATAALALDRAEDVRRAARLIGALAGAARAADSLVAAFDSARGAAARESAPPAGRRPRLYVHVWTDPPVTVGRGSYLAEILRDAGAENLFDDVPTSSATVSLESLARRNPDAVVVLTSDTLGAPPPLGDRPPWRAVEAVREGRFLLLDGSLYGRPSPRMPFAVRDLAARLRRLPVR